MDDKLTRLQPLDDAVAQQPVRVGNDPDHFFHGSPRLRGTFSAIMVRGETRPPLLIHYVLTPGGKDSRGADMIPDKKPRGVCPLPFTEEAPAQKEGRLTAARQLS
jgi:hypothetical protein